MKKIILPFVTVLVLSLTIQDNESKFTYDINGMNKEYLVVTIDSTTQQKNFNKSLNWIKETYKNPDEVIKTTIENKKIRFEGSERNLICIKSLGLNTCYNARYSIEIELKENKYKFTPLNLSYRVPGSQYGPARTIYIDFKDGSMYYKKNQTIRTAYQAIPSSIENLFNSLNNSLNDYIKKESFESADDDW